MKVRTLQKHHPLPGGRLTLLGASDGVTGAMTRVELGGAALLVDCGLPQGADARGWELPGAALDVDTVILTHAHLDHVGSVSDLLRFGFTGPIYGTPATLRIAELVLRDSMRLAGHTEGDISQVRRALAAQRRPIHYDAPLDVAGFGGRVILREAGHIIGSASVEIETPEARVICSGDLGRPGSPLLADYNTTWHGERPVDLVVMESTYGAREHRHGPWEIERTLERLARRAHAERGHLLVPAFSIGRTQALLYHLNRLVNAGKIQNLPVALDSTLGLRVTEIYQQFTGLLDTQAEREMRDDPDPFDFGDLYSVRGWRASRLLDTLTEPCLVIAGSGMCTGGKIVGHLEALLPRPETTVLFVGYQARGTLGATLQRARPGQTVAIGPHAVPVRAHIETVSGLSAHADRRELGAWLARVPSLSAVALHHGEPAAQRALSRYLTSARSVEDSPRGSRSDEAPETAPTPRTYRTFRI